MADKQIKVILTADGAAAKREIAALGTDAAKLERIAREAAQKQQEQERTIRRELQERIRVLGLVGQAVDAQSNASVRAFHAEAAAVREFAQGMTLSREESLKLEATVRRTMDRVSASQQAAIEATRRQAESAAAALQRTNAQALQHADQLKGRYAGATLQVAQGVEQLARSGNLVGEGLKGVIAQGAQMALMFGAAGPIVGAVGIAGLAIFDVFARARKEMEATRQKAEEELARLKKGGDFRATQAVAQEQLAEIRKAEAALARLQQERAGARSQSAGIGLGPGVGMASRTREVIDADIAAAETRLNKLRESQSLVALEADTQAKAAGQQNILEELRARRQASRLELLRLESEAAQAILDKQQRTAAALEAQAAAVRARLQLERQRSLELGGSRTDLDLEDAADAAVRSGQRAARGVAQRQREDALLQRGIAEIYQAAGRKKDIRAPLQEGDLTNIERTSSLVPEETLTLAERFKVMRDTILDTDQATFRLAMTLEEMGRKGKAALDLALGAGADAFIQGNTKALQALKRMAAEPIVAELKMHAISQAKKALGAIADWNPVKAAQHTAAAAGALLGARQVAQIGGISGGGGEGSGGNGGMGGGRGSDFAGAALGAGRSASQVTRVELVIVQKTPDGRELARQQQTIQNQRDRNQPVRVTL